MKPWVGLMMTLLLTGCPAPPPAPMDAALERASESTPPPPVDTKALTDALAQAGRPSINGQPIDEDTFPYPVYAGLKTADGYPLYVMHCTKTVCLDRTGRFLGTRAEVAARLTPVRNVDARNPIYQCDWVCTDVQDHVVGAVSPEMRAFLHLPPLPISSLEHSP